MDPLMSTFGEERAQRPGTTPVSRLIERPAPTQGRACLETAESAETTQADRVGQESAGSTG